MGGKALSLKCHFENYKILTFSKKIFSFWHCLIFFPFCFLGLQFFLVMACSESWIPKLNMLEIFRNSGNCCFCIYNDLLGESIDLIKHIEKNNFRRGNMKGNLIFWPSLYQLFRMIFNLFYSLTMISSFCSITM